MSLKVYLTLIMAVVALAVLPAVGQKGSLKAVPDLVLSKKASQTNFAQTSLFQKVAATVEERGVDKAVTEATFLELDMAATKSLLQSETEAIELNLPYQKGMMAVELVEVDILTEDFTVLTSLSDGQPVTYSGGKFFRGIVKGNPNSIATLSVFEDEVIGMLSPNETETLVLGKLGGTANKTDYILYSDKNLLATSDFNCHTETPDDIGSKIAAIKAAKTGEPEMLMVNCVRQYLEADYALFTDKGSVSSTVNFLAGLFNEVSALYANEGITTSLSQVFVWVTQDNYSVSSSTTALTQFNNTRSVFNGDLAMLVVLGGNNTGGLAYLDGLCNNSLRYAYADIDNSYQTIPTYSWSVFVVAHEIGHNYGSPHTHACAWGSNNDEPIDCCGANAGFPDDDCSDCTLPDPAEGGTLMSYCHLRNVGVNFNNGFGDEPGALIFANYNAAMCLSNCSSAPCNAPSGLSVSNIQTNQATISWTAAAGATSYNIQVKTNSNQTWQNFNLTSTSITITNLSPGQAYNAQVETVCAGGTSGFPEGVAFSTLVACPPAASNTLASQNPVCPGFNFTLSLSATYSTGYTFQWQSSANGSVYSNISGAISSTLITTQTAATWYRCEITCQSNSILSTPIQVAIENEPLNCYCEPASTTCSGLPQNPYMRINRVTLGALDNPNNSCSGNGYGEYLDGQSIPDLVIGGSEFITVDFGDYQQRQTVFIDFNRDGDFEDEGESTNIPYIGTYSQTGTIAVPTSATVGQTRMRVRSRYWNDNVFPSNPCNGGFYGETEDYLVNLVPCSGTCYAAPQTTRCTSPGYFFRISRVQLGTLDNQNNACGTTGGYEDYTVGQVVPVLTAGSNATISVTIGTVTQRIAVFIDFNQNGSFSDAGETINIPYSNLATQTVNFQIPSEALAGQTRMRVRSRNSVDSLYPLAYDGGYYGETEDYTVDIQSLLPVDLVSFTATNFKKDQVKLQWKSASEENVAAYQVQRSSDARDFIEISTVPATGSPNMPALYEAVDQQPLHGVNYYRLKMVDLDGFHEYSSIEQVVTETEKLTILSISPNPATHHLSLRLLANEEQPIDITILNTAMIPVKKLSINALKGETTAMLEIGDLPSGVYIICVDNGINSVFGRLVRQ